VASPSCLETTELSVENDGLDWRAVESDLKDRLSARLSREGREDLSQILDGCGVEIFLRCSECQERVRGSARCKKRWCPVCAVSIAAERVAKFTRAVLSMRWPLHITLTVSNTQDLDSATLRRLLKCFRRLRQRRAWKDSVRGGFASLEITNRGNGWHPHLHIIADCEWFGITTAPPSRSWSREKKLARFRESSAELGREWSDIVGQASASVKIRRRYGGDAGAKSLALETMKYAVKAGDLLATRGSAAEIIDAMRSVRLFRGFGTCYRLKLDEEPKEPCPCGNCGALRSLMPEEVLERKERYDAKKQRRKRR